MLLTNLRNWVLQWSCSDRDKSMKFIRKLPDADEMRMTLPLTSQQEKRRQDIITELVHILLGKTKKKILIIGPCSADRQDAVLAYMERLADLAEQVKDSFCIIPRIYTSKPRTTGKGYKGLVHRPNLESEKDDIYDGIVAARKMHLKIIQETGLFGADEMLYPEAHYYVSDLLAYTSVGARSVENQQHRLVASGLDMPVGMKNPTSGDNEIMLNAILAAQSKQRYIYQGFECESDGNIFTHAILRGYTDTIGKSHSNYHFEDISDLYDLYQKKNLKNANVVIDCSHGNSRKHYDEQIRISKEILMLCHESVFINNFVKGLMIESYIEDGSQMIGEGIFGKSITDSCLGWDKTERLVLELAEIYS